jgi:uncharacterized membrane protein YfcA
MAGALAGAKVTVRKGHRFVRHFVAAMVIIFALKLFFG